jgi:signal transduction histidine kinase
MDETIFASVYLGDARLAAYATSASAVWLWRADGGRILWANPAGCAALGAKSPHTLLERDFAIGDPARTHIERLAETVPPGGGARLFRLRGVAGVGWSSLTCSCARFDFGRTSAVLVVATEPVGVEVPLAERVSRLGFPEPAAVAAYAPDGAMIFATAAAEHRLAGAPGLDAIGVALLATAALATGAASGESMVGPIVLQRIGRGANTVLLVEFPQPVTAEKGRAADGARPAPAPETRPENAPSPEPKRMPAERRHPLRFVWQIDAAGRFSFESDAFAGLIGAAAEAVSGRPWSEINAELGLDPEGRVAQAIASRETWNNITVWWPTGEGDERLEVDLAGLPAFDRNRSFLGYRGFGVCRDLAQIERLAAMREASASASAPVLSPGETSGPTAGVGESVTEQAAPFSHPDAIAPALPPIAPNVVRFPGAGTFADLRGTEPDSPGLTTGEHGAFHELARQLSVRLQAADAEFGELRPLPADLSGTAPSGRLSPAVQIPTRAAASLFDDGKPGLDADDRGLLNRLPVGVLVYRYEELLFANRAFLALTGYPDLLALTVAGGLDTLFPDAGVGALAEAADAGRRVAIATREGEKVPVEGRLFAVQWEGESAFAVLLFRTAAHEQIGSLEAALAEAEALAGERGRLLDRVEDCVLVVARDGTLVSVHGGARSFFGRGGRTLVGAAFEGLFAPDGRAAVAAQLARVAREGVAVSVEVTALAANGELRPVTVTMAPAGSAPDAARFDAVLHDLSVAKGAGRVEATPAKVAALDTAAALGRLCHDARSPINSILGFCDIILAESFGPVGSPRYREYIRDIKASGAEVMSRLAEAAELAGIIAGTARLSPARVSLNDVVNACVAEQQAPASEARVVIRTALSPGLAPILADAEAVRSIIVNLLGRALHTTRPGGQVIVSTGRSAGGDAVLRVRDNGEGLNEKAIETALQTGPRPPSDPWDASTWDGGQASGLALARALAEANHARFTITSKPHQGSLFEVIFTARPERAAPDRPSIREEAVPKPADGNR